MFVCCVRVARCLFCLQVCVDRCLLCVVRKCDVCLFVDSWLLLFVGCCFAFVD